MENEDCIRCGKLTREGSNLCEGCISEEERYKDWKFDLHSSYKEFERKVI